MPMTVRPVRFEKDTLTKLDKLAAIEDRDSSYLIRQAVDDLLEAHEWQVQQSLDVIEKIKSGEMKTHSHADVRAKFQKKRSAV